LGQRAACADEEKHEQSAEHLSGLSFCHGFRPLLSLTAYSFAGEQVR
jgi:hypothetical protein